MKNFLSIDIETTGLDENRCQILEFGAVLGDFEDSNVFGLPHFRRRFRYPELRGEPYALALNAPLIKEMALGGPGWTSINPLWEDFNSWLSPLKVGKPTVAGKNVASFDRRFLALAPKWDWGAFSRRFLDPGSLFLDPKQDLELPDLTTCASRAGVDAGRFELHNAVDDARLVVEIVRAYYRGK